MTTILIADDSRFQLAVLTGALEARGFKVVTAEDGLQASMIALRTKPDAIVLDISMPGGSGLEVVRRLKRSTKTREIPVVIVTADSGSSARETALSLGASEFFSKPIKMDELAVRLSELCPQPISPQGAPQVRASTPPSLLGPEVNVAQASDLRLTPATTSKPLRSWREILQDVTDQHATLRVHNKNGRP